MERDQFQELFKRIYWKWQIDIHHGDTIRMRDSDEIEYFKIHQEWKIDTTKNNFLQILNDFKKKVGTTLDRKI